ncbi:MAG: peptidase C11 [Lachnospiraceae bacterium]|nr:peptidase C11 [Lachnospiraceae bacterium]
MAENEQNNRKKGSLHRRGEGLGTGPVGNGPRGEELQQSTGHEQSSQQSAQSTGYQSAQQKPQSSSYQSAQQKPQSSSYQSSQSQSSPGWTDLQQTPNSTGSSQQSSPGWTNLQAPNNTAGTQQGSSWQQSSQQYSQAQQAQQSQQTQNLEQTPNDTGKRSSGGRLKRILIFVGLIILLIIIWKSCRGCGDNSGYYDNDSYNNLTTQAPTSQANNLTTQAPQTQATETEPQIDYETYGDLNSILAGLGLGNMIGTAGTGSYDAGSDLTQLTGSNSSYNGWTDLNGNTTTTGNTGTVNTQTVQSARAKYTTIQGGGRDTVTIMLFMCGTDLESSYKMGTSDLQEMLNSNCGGNVNLIVYTGGCKRWQNNVVSNQKNQIYQVKNGQLTCLASDAGTGAMTDPKTLSDFIKVCAQNFPANRYELILWDHGGGSVSGYGYDEKQRTQDTMDLSEISKALKDGGVKFDMIGFDACLMATAETALMLDAYGDYMVASEESEPGIGWYYTEWLRQLTQNPSIDTVTLGKKIADDFVTQCGKSCHGQATTLSVVALAEFAAVVPAQLSSFATSTSNLVSTNYQTVSNARSRTHEFAASSKIDQIDLVHFAKNLGTTEGKNLANALLSAIKYNTTSSDVTNAYGISIYFPYRRTSYVDKAVKTYSAIGLDSAYSKCIQNFAAVGSSGQMATGGTSNYSSSVFDMLSGGSQQSSTGTLLDLLGGTSSSSSYSSSSSSSDLISGLLGSYLGGGSSSSSSSGSILGSLLSGMDDSNSSFLFGRAKDAGFIEDTAEYIADHMIEREKFNWTKNPDGEKVLSLTKDDWALLTDLQTSVYYDDGAGYIDLGTDQIYSFDKYGNLTMPTAKNWMAVVGVDKKGQEVEQPVAYYLDSVVRNGSQFTLTGHIPVLINSIADVGAKSGTEVGMLGNLTVIFDNENPKGYISGMQLVYNDGTEVQAKNVGFARLD